jgi:hypothetical protein
MGLSSLRLIDEDFRRFVPKRNLKNSARPYAKTIAAERACNHEGTVASGVCNHMTDRPTREHFLRISTAHDANRCTDQLTGGIIETEGKEHRLESTSLISGL